MRGKCERRGGNINADGAGAEVFVGDEHSRERLFCPMALISRREQGGRIYNNTRTREPLRRKCVKPRRPHHPFPTEDLRPPPHSDAPCPSTFAPPTQPRRTPAGCAMHSSPTSRHIPRRRSSPAPAQRHALPLPSCHIPTAPTQTRRLRRHTPANLTTHSPAAPPCLPFCSASGTKKRHRTVDVRCRMSRSTVVAVGHWGW